MTGHRTSAEQGKKSGSSLSRPVKFLASLLVVTVVSLATLFVLEFAVRWAIPAYDPSGHIRFIAGKDERPLLGVANSQQRQIKNTGDFDVTIRFNKYGFRDQRDLAKSGFDDYFVTGDSVSFGWGVEETDRVSEQLERIIGKPVYNISTPVSLDGTKKLIDYAEKKGAKIGNLIIFFGTEVRMLDYESPPSPATPSPTVKRLFSRLKPMLRDNSALYFLFTSFVHRNPSLRNFAIRAGLIDPTMEGFPIHEYDPKAIESTAKYLARFAERKDRRLTVVVLPMRTLWIGPSQKTEDRILRTFVARLRELDLDVLDLRLYFEDGGRPFQYFFKNDGHWNPAGHAMVGRAVARHLGFNTEGGKK